MNRFPLRTLPALLAVVAFSLASLSTTAQARERQASFTGAKGKTGTIELSRQP
jgi:hypothetical protein